MQRQKLRARKEDEAQKRHRTVFVGNLPVSCTKKVRRERGESAAEHRKYGRWSHISLALSFRCCGASSGTKGPSSPSGFALW